MNTQKNESPPSLTLKRRIRAKREKVYEAWTKPELMKQWFFCGARTRCEVKNELRVGGAYQNTMYFEADPSAGCGSHKEVETVNHTGEYLELIPPEKIVFTWSSHLVTNSRVTIVLSDKGDFTELVLTHELLETEELRQMHNGGWEGCLENLEKFFA